MQAMVALGAAAGDVVEATEEAATEVVGRFTVVVAMVQVGLATVVVVSEVEGQVYLVGFSLTSTFVAPLTPPTGAGAGEAVAVVGQVTVMVAAMEGRPDMLLLAAGAPMAVPRRCLMLMTAVVRAKCTVAKSMLAKLTAV